MDRYLKTANRNRCATMVHTWPLVFYSSYHQSSLRTSRTVIGNIYADLSRTIATAKTTQERNVQLNQDVTEILKKHGAMIMTWLLTHQKPSHVIY